MQPKKIGVKETDNWQPKAKRNSNDRLKTDIPKQNVGFGDFSRRRTALSVTSEKSTLASSS
jgi:hypothetical protein